MSKAQFNSPPVGRLGRFSSVGFSLVVACATATSFCAVDGAPLLAAEEKEEIPLPEEIIGGELTTRDGVQLAATFLGSIEGKKAVPVILLHMRGGDRTEYTGLAELLQKKHGCAVLIPDLRGHGQSTTQITGPGTTREIDAAKFRPGQFAAMVKYDMETLKAFLMKKNNAGELNIEKLVVVGGEMGASVALDWARHDWSWPALVGRKQGQDVKALVLLSPKFSFPGITLQGALSHPEVRSRLPMLIVVGQGDSRCASDARRVESMLARYHPEPKEPSQKDLYFVPLDTKLQGTKILGVPGVKLYGKNQVVAMEAGIAAFIQRQLVEKTFPWKERE